MARVALVGFLFPSLCGPVTGLSAPQVQASSMWLWLSRKRAVRRMAKLLMRSSFQACCQNPVQLPFPNTSRPESETRVHLRGQALDEVVFPSVLQDSRVRGVSDESLIEKMQNEAQLGGLIWTVDGHYFASENTAAG